jgi:hypothetical protein
MHRPAAVTVPLPRDPRHGIAVLARSARDAVDLLRQSRELRSSLWTQTALFGVGGVMSVIGIARVHEVANGARALILAEVGAALILGLITGALLAGWFRDRTLPERTVSVGALLAGVAIAGMGRASTPLPWASGPPRWACRSPPCSS